ncbi:MULTISPECIES: LamB/YcsF family protein [unclassified Haladaptatus]|uniref:LamB/YcsF family protein n=1 Tax=unclassified Haladaptatus TaxID=2622732 RepID=UPI0023E82971|nr:MULTISPECIES: 5-oxoprolinase subunit PxpA [unclassified Haladaptatus]
MVSVDINCDMGESYGNWTMGNDAGVMPLITSANIAADYHAGDPHVMRETIKLAAEHDVGVGVHPGLPDRMGFGRRTMDASPEEVRDFVIHQLGGIMGFAAYYDVPVQHVKPHGAMYTMLSQSADHTRAVVEGLLEVDPSLVFVATDMNIYNVAQEYDALRSVFEGFIDIDYRPDGTLIVERQVGPRDTDLMVERFVSIATEGELETPSGEVIDMPAETICIHGDGANAVEILEAIHAAKDDYGIELATLDEIV